MSPKLGLQSDLDYLRRYISLLIRLQCASTAPRHQRAGAIVIMRIYVSRGEAFVVLLDVSVASQQIKSSVLTAAGIDY